MKVVSSEAMAVIDRRAQDEFAIPPALLMEDAGVSAWSLFVRRVCAGKVQKERMVFVVGKGNNGGDALVMARRALCQGVHSSSIVLADGRPVGGIPAQMLAICEAYGIECLSWPTQRDEVLTRFREAAWILDGIAGTGIRGGLRAPLSELVGAINASPAQKAGIDVPSGVSDDFDPAWPVVRCDVTLTMGLPKVCLYLPHARALCGRILVVPVGFPPALVEDPAISGEILPFNAWRNLLKPIPPDTHKGRRGHLAVFAGSPGTTGAAWLSANAAARSRLGLVSLHVGHDVYPILAQKATSVMVKPWDEPHPPDWGGSDLGAYTGFLVGPGWGLAEERERWLEHLISQKVSGAIDADGITLLSRISKRAQVRLGGRWVITPHPGEFARISGIPRDEVLRDPPRYALELSSRLDAIVVLKGHCTTIASPAGKYWILDGSNPALATGGSGDVLAGLIAAGIAGGIRPLDAALFGVSLHASLGREARDRFGWFLAEDLVPLVSRMLR
jgi:NAD(P)H-hydrate epimerase